MERHLRIWMKNRETVSGREPRRDAIKPDVAFKKMGERGIGITGAVCTEFLPAVVKVHRRVKLSLAIRGGRRRIAWVAIG